MKKLSYIFFALAILLSNVMCAAIAYDYRGLICAAEHQGFSAPANIAFIYAIPYLVAIIATLALAILCYKKSK